ncbi:MAG: bacteriophage holin [Kiloniellaceae bacterium]
MAENGRHMTLGVVSFGLAVGVTWAIFVFLLGVMAALFGWGVEVAQMLASLYIGFSPTVAGTIAGAVWAFVDGMIAGVLIAWFYNRFVLRRRAPRRGPPSA